jgi:iron complex outermembrane receptor protein
MGVSTLALMISGLPQAVLAAAAAPSVSDSGDVIIVTGTRDVGVKAQESPTPIEVVGADALAATGQNNVFDALKNLLPSLTAAAENFDTSEMVRSARLRGMSPNEVLILVNGKRRHTTANINADQGPDVASNPADLDMIPISMIDHVEVLMDGAAAQYGSDAVAGVINIILKNASHGTNVSVTGGITTRGDGAQGAGSASQAIALGADGFLDIGVDYKHQDFMSRGGFDCRTQTSFNADPNCGSYKQYVRGPVKNPIDGLPLMDLVTGGFNAEKPVNDDITVYAFGTAGWRGADAYENDRLGNAVSTIYPLGFEPQETLNEVDGSITGGVKGSHLLGGWDWDVSATYGRDSDDIGVRNTANGGMLKALGYTPLQVYAGTETNTQLVTNADFRRPFDLDFFAAPLNVAFGGEYRHESYTIDPGEPASFIDGGTQSYSGFTPEDASSHSRNAEAAYLDLSTKILPKWTVDIAGRFETYDQEGVGNTFNKKLTTRYDIAPELGIRGTIADGFHAPTLAQTSFSSTNIGPLPNGGQNYYIQLPLTSPGAAVLGAPALKPEKSKEVSAGLVAEPLPKWHVTADAYQIFLDGRIINTGHLSGPLAVAAAAANGNSTPPGSQSFVSFFTNGVNTRTRGLDVTTDYKTDFKEYGFVTWTLAANWNSNSITGYNNSPALAGAFTPNVITDLTKASPQNKVTASANWVIGDFDITLRETRYGHVDQTNTSSSVVPYYNIFIKSAYITDLDIGYNITDSLKWTVGGNNIFDKMPSHLPEAAKTVGRLSESYPVYAPWGLSGAYFYTRISASF